jgi:4-amino-4-deoxy-L-arabinose transferase-like glycosyltransferase
MSVGMRWVFILLNKIPFNSDEAIVGLMANHILKGENPIFFYGQAYMGSLDGYIVAGFFALLGNSITALRISQSILFVLFIVAAYYLAYLLFKSRKAALITIIILGCSPVNFFLYTTVTLGGYLEALLIGICILIVGIRIEENEEFGVKNTYTLRIQFFMLGLFVGIGIWVLGITLIFSISALIMLGINLYRKKLKFGRIIEALAIMIAGCVLGGLPVLVYIYTNGVGVFLNELMGSAISIGQQAYLNQIGLHLVNFILFGISAVFGFRPPWNANWLLLPLIPIILAIWVLLIRRTYIFEQKSKSTSLRIWLPSIILMVVFVLTPFGMDPSGRYFIPINISLAFTVGLWISLGGFQKNIHTLLILSALLVYNIGGIIQSAYQSPDGITTQFAPGTSIDHKYDQELIDFLKESSNTRGYSTYWTAYPIAFRSNEDVILVPVLPYHADLKHTTRDNRYEPYSKLVNESHNPVYITSNNPGLDRQLVMKLTELGVKWSEKLIGDYRVYYQLSRKVLPEEIGFGIDRQ